MGTQLFDIAVVGAGMAGLVCAQQLQQAGYSVVVLEKSRGVGGRMATRRVSGTRADHGLRYLEARGKFLPQLINFLESKKNGPGSEQILQLWTDKIYELTQPRGKLLPMTQRCYIAPQGMNSVGKFLAQGLEIWFSRRVETMEPTTAKNWCLTLAATNDTATEKPTTVMSKAVVLAIPAPQALMILAQPVAEISSEFLQRLGFVEYDPCITVMAGYSASLQENLPEWQAIAFPNDDCLAWVGIDSSKRLHSTQPVFVIQSNAQFATTHLDSTDLQPVGEKLLNHTAQQLLPWLSSPEWLQVHRWRYAFCRQPLAVSCLTTELPLPLVGAGDWCSEDNSHEEMRRHRSDGGLRPLGLSAPDAPVETDRTPRPHVPASPRHLVEGAFASGLAAANWMNSQLENLPLPGENFLSHIEVI